MKSSQNGKKQLLAQQFQRQAKWRTMKRLGVCHIPCPTYIDIHLEPFTGDLNFDTDNPKPFVFSRILACKFDEHKM